MRYGRIVKEAITEVLSEFEFRIRKNPESGGKDRGVYYPAEYFVEIKGELVGIISSVNVAVYSGDRTGWIIQEYNAQEDSWPKIDKVFRYLTEAKEFSKKYFIEKNKDWAEGSTILSDYHSTGWDVFESVVDRVVSKLKERFQHLLSRGGSPSEGVVYNAALQTAVNEIKENPDSYEFDAELLAVTATNEFLHNVRKMVWT